MAHNINIMYDSMAWRSQFPPPIKKHNKPLCEIYGVIITEGRFAEMCSNKYLTRFNKGSTTVKDTKAILEIADKIETWMVHCTERSPNDTTLFRRFNIQCCQENSSVMLDMQAKESEGQDRIGRLMPPQFVSLVTYKIENKIFTVHIEPTLLTNNFKVESIELHMDVLSYILQCLTDKDEELSVGKLISVCYQLRPTKYRIEANSAHLFRNEV